MYLSVFDQPASRVFFGILLGLQVPSREEDSTMREDGWHETNIRVRYKDTDRMGVVYYGNYLTFFEIGRAELMRELDFPYSKLEAEGFTLVVTEASAKYHANVGYDALVTVKTRIGDQRGARVRFDYEVISEEKKLLVTGHTVHGCINASMKPTRLPEDLRKLIGETFKG
jgi:acyl-CoA thioester hydrolase